VTVTPNSAVPSERSPYALFSAVTGVTALAVLLQGVWAGLFLEHDGKRDKATASIAAHNVGGSVALALAVVALVIAVVKLRSRKDLLVGTSILVVLLAVEYMLGMLIHNQSKDALTAIHVPLALVITAVTVWLPLRSRHAVSRS
jgi:hypothetical protein